MPQILSSSSGSSARLFYILSWQRFFKADNIDFFFRVFDVFCVEVGDNLVNTNVKKTANRVNDRYVKAGGGKNEGQLAIHRNRYFSKSERFPSRYQTLLMSLAHLSSL